LNGIADIRFKNELNADYESLYNEIADSDLEESMQPQELKEARAKQDIVNLKRVLKGKSALRVLEIGPGSGHLLGNSPLLVPFI
jgi:16S rRNA A1518/A1519 N6-dimethyltransferase RsmA/KsgA/DIM1 with predicted DNA glycosylase/AP lyase activity